MSAFRKWLLDAEQWRPHAAPTDELPPDAGGSVDLHAVVSEWIALRQEVRLEARGGKTSRERMDQASEAFRQGIEGAGNEAAKLVRQLVEERDRVRDEYRGKLESQQREWVDVLLEVRDALARGADAARGGGQHLGWKRWFVSAGFAEAVAEGYDLGLRRIDAALESRGVRPMECVGLPVDPERMRVVDVVPGEGTPEGHVVEVLRRGYVRGDRVVRCAEVRAAARLS